MLKGSRRAARLLQGVAHFRNWESTPMTQQLFTFSKSSSVITLIVESIIFFFFQFLPRVEGQQPIHQTRSSQRQVQLQTVQFCKLINSVFTSPYYSLTYILKHHNDPFYSLNFHRFFQSSKRLPWSSTNLVKFAALRRQVPQVGHQGLDIPFNILLGQTRWGRELQTRDHIGTHVHATILIMRWACLHVRGGHALPLHCSISIPIWDHSTILHAVSHVKSPNLYRESTYSVSYIEILSPDICVRLDALRK